MDNKFMDLVIKNMDMAYVLQEAIFDQENQIIDFRNVECNHSFEKFCNRSWDEIKNLTIRQLSPDIERHESQIFQLYLEIMKEENEESFSREFHSIHNGKWYQLNIFKINPSMIAVIGNDITELKNKETELIRQKNDINLLYEEQTALYEEITATEEELRQQNDELLNTYYLIRENERRLNNAQRVAHVGNWEIDLKTMMMWNSDEALRLIESEAKQNTFSVEYATGIFPEEEQLRLDKALKDLLQNNTPYDYEMKFYKKDGSLRFYRNTAELEFDKDKNPTRVLGLVQDVTYQHMHDMEMQKKNTELTKLNEILEQSKEELRDNYMQLKISLEENKKQQDILEYLAYNDSLTNLPNRVLFMDRLNIAITMSEKNNTKTAVVFMDIDNFKKVNDTLGHNIGDKLLKSFAKRLEKLVPKYYTLARISGDEFAFILQGISSKAEAYIFCQDIRNRIAELFELDGYNFNMNTSMGIVAYPEDGTTTEELLKNVNTAIYHAKSLGKNNIQNYTESMKTGMERRISIEQGLRRSLKTGEFRIAYQPQIDIKTGKVRALEALLRWKDRDLSSVSPVEFIPIAEETGIILLLGEWVLREACRQTAYWNSTDYPGLIIAVNISAIQIAQPDFSKLVKGILKETKLKPENLEIEITESIFINSMEDAISMLNELKEMGIKIAMDDFGTGYSSLNYLKKLPLDTLKVDKSFIQDIDNESWKKEITGAMITLLHKLQIQVVAEGVETATQLEYLGYSECDIIQGFLMCKPVFDYEIPEVMKKNFKGIIEDNNKNG